jgi:hypothetical protein
LHKKQCKQFLILLCGYAANEAKLQNNGRKNIALVLELCQKVLRAHFKFTSGCAYSSNKGSANAG